MAIRYRIEENNLKPGTFYARVIAGDARDLDAMIPNIVAKTALSGTDVKAVINALVDEVIAALAVGQTAKVDGLVSFSLSLSGSFETNDVSITREMARLNVLAREDHALESAVAAQASYTRQVTPIKAPTISSVFDVATGIYDSYTAPGILRLKGENLKFNPENADEGVFLNDGATETRLTVYSVTGDRQVDAMLPPGLSGDLTVTVRARYTEDGDLRGSSYQRPISPA